MEDAALANSEFSSKRISKACTSCRAGKVKCEGGSPCPRCRAHKRDCVYEASEHREGRMEALEQELKTLRGELTELRSQAASNDYRTNFNGSLPHHSGELHDSPGQHHPHSGFSTAGDATHRAPSSIQHLPVEPSPATACYPVVSPLSTAGTDLSRKRKRSQLEMYQQNPHDFVASGVIGVDQARSYYTTFFQGCDRYVPIFDPIHDTFDSIRRRSGFLFNAICTTGSSIKEEAGSRLPHMLNFELKKQLNLIVVSRERQVLETVQALLVLACYSPERSLILSFATRTALDLSLNEAFEKLTRRLLPTSSNLTETDHDQENAELTRRSRTWFGLLVLENILHVDAGKLPTFTSKGGARRCRVLLQQPYSTALDLRLLSQVELNYIRARIYDTLAVEGYDQDEDILDDIRDARIDIELWYNDWFTVISSSPKAGSETPSLLTNLAVQRHWSDAMAAFRALKCLGTDNIDAMGQTGRDLLDMAKVSLKKHLAITIDESNAYLVNLRFSMDFVWAKCAFCFLLILKLTRLLPESEESNFQLLEDGHNLLRQLSSATTGAGSSASKLYLQVLGMSLEKYGRALRENHRDQLGSNQDSAVFFWESSDANKELQSFVPEQFVFEWDFPGLTLFSSPTAWQEFFDDFLLGFGGQESGALPPS